MASIIIIARSEMCSSELFKSNIIGKIAKATINVATALNAKR